MLKVAFVTANLDMGGAERNIVTLAPALDRRRFESSVYCLEREGALFDELRDDGVDARCLGGGALRTTWKLWRSLRRSRPDVVVTSGFKAGILGRLVGRSTGAATLCWKHNCGHLGLVGVKERCAERFLGPLTTRYLGVCFAQVPYLVDVLRLDPGRIGVLYNSIPTDKLGLVSTGDRAALGLEADDLIVGIVAVLRAEKDHATLFRALARVRADGIPAVLAVVGDGPERQRLVDLADDLGLTSSIRFLGQRPDVESLLPMFDVVALASFTIECFPYAILEAMAAARPVVVTSVGGLPEMVEHGVTGYLAPPKAPEAIADALSMVLADATRAAALGAAGRRRLDERWPFAAAVESFQREVATAAHRREGSA